MVTILGIDSDPEVFQKHRGGVPNQGRFPGEDDTELSFEKANWAKKESQDVPDKGPTYVKSRGVRKYGVFREQQT